VRTGVEHHLLGIVIHHIAADGWSLGPLTRDLAAAYIARHEGGAPAWTPLPVQYADFGLWQREVLGADTDPDSLAVGQLDYCVPPWRTARGAAAAYDRPRPVAPTPGRGHGALHVSDPLQRALAELAREQGVSMFMVLRSALAVLLRFVTAVATS